MTHVKHVTHMKETTSCIKDPSHEDRKHETYATCDPVKETPHKINQILESLHEDRNT